LWGGASAPRARLLPGALCELPGIRPSGSSACGAEAPPHKKPGNALVRNGVETCYVQSDIQYTQTRNDLLEESLLVDPALYWQNASDSLPRT